MKTVKNHSSQCPSRCLDKNKVDHKNMTYKEILTRYTEARQAIDAYKEENAEVFAGLTELETTLAELENELKATVRKLGRALENNYVSATPVESTRRYFDWSVIEQLSTPDELQAIKTNALKSVEVDPKAMQQLVLDGAIAPKIVQEAYREEAMTTRVTIKVK